MRIVATIEARMQSTRLPGKVLKPVLGRPMLALMIERLQRCSLLDGIAIATTSDTSCDPIAALGHELGVTVHRGSEDDVMARVLDTARAVDADIIVETTGDCPLIDPAIVDQVIQAYLDDDVDYCANVLERTYPRGMDVQVFPTRVLAQAAALTSDPADREHVSLYIYRHPERFRLKNVASELPPHQQGHRLTVDTADDLALVRAIYERLYPTDPAFGLGDILALLETEPELAALNRHVEQKHV